MGTHRAFVKLEFEMHGVKRKTEMSINWFPDYDSADHRISEFFKVAADHAYAKYMQDNRERFEAERSQAADTAERQEYERLRAKFEPK